MGVRENKIERYLDNKITEMNGITRKWVSPGHDGVMDRICFLNPEWYVEVKTADGVQGINQHREATRLIDCGARVALVYGYSGVDEFIKWMACNVNSQPKVQLIFK